MPVRRRRRAALAAAALPLLLTACSSGPDPARAAGDYGPVAGAAEPSPLSPAQARDAARRIGLQAEDLPLGFRPDPPDHDDGGRAEREFASCIGASAPSSYLADATSSFEDGDGVNVSSDVTVLSSTADLARDLRALRGPDTDRCVQELLATGVRRTAGDASVRLSEVTSTPLSVSSGRGDVTWARSYRFSLHGPRGTLPVRMDWRSWWRGRTHVDVTVVTLGAALPEGVRDRAFEAVVDRARGSAV